MKQAASGSMARRHYITPARFKNTTFGLKDLFKLMRAANHGRKSRAFSPRQNRPQRNEGQHVGHNHTFRNPDPDK